MMDYLKDFVQDDIDQVAGKNYQERRPPSQLFERFAKEFAERSASEAQGVST